MPGCNFRGTFASFAWPIQGGGGLPLENSKEIKSVVVHSDRFLQKKSVGIFLRSEGAVSRTIPMEDTQYKLHFADMIPKSNHIGFIHQTVC